MGLLGDIQEAKNVWLGASWKFKIIIGVSVFFAVSSIASLSDTVFAWKGFLLKGVIFYEEYIITPITKYAEMLGLTWDNKNANYIVLFGLWLSSIIREIWTRSSLNNKRIIMLNVFQTLAIISLFTYLSVGLSGGYILNS